MASSQVIAWEGGVEGAGSLPENTSVPCCPSDPFSVQIHLYHFLEYWVPLFMTQHGPSHLPARGVGGWYHGSHLSQTECFIQGVVLSLSVTSFQSQSTISICPNELVPSVPQICPLLGLLYRAKNLLHGPRVSQTKEKKPQTFPEIDSGVGSRHTATSHTGQLYCVPE